MTLLASCKWTNGTQGDAERVKLESIASGLRTKGKRPIFYFFSWEGFGEKLIASAKADPKRYRLIDFQTGELAERKA